MIYIHSAENLIDMSKYIRRGAKINMESQKIVDCAHGSVEDDVVTITGLAAYYRTGFPLTMQGEQIINLALISSVNDAVTHH